MANHFSSLKEEDNQLRGNARRKGTFFGLEERIKKFLDKCVKESIYIYDPDNREELWVMVGYWASILSSITGENMSIPMLRPPSEDPTKLDPITIKKSWTRDEVESILKSGAKVILSGDLRGMDLEGLDFTNVEDLDGVDLSGSNLKGAKFRKGIVFRNVDLIGTDMEDVECENMSFQKVTLIGVKLINANLKDTNFSPETDFGYSDLSKADLSNATLKRVKMIACRLDGATLNQTQFTNANLGYASLVGITGSPNFTKAELYVVDLERAILNGATFDNSSLWGSSMVRAELKNCSFVKIDFSNVDLHDANFAGSNVEGAVFREAIRLEGAKLMNAKNLEKAELSDEQRKMLISKGPLKAEEEVMPKEKSGSKKEAITLNAN